MLLEIEPTSEIPIYQQLINQITVAVANGSLAEGERLPSVRLLAADLGINPMTVSKAYTRLKQEGLIVIDRRQGAKVAPVGYLPGSGTGKDGVVSSAEIFDQSFDRELTLLLSQAAARGADEEKLLKHVEKLLQQIYGKKDKKKDKKGGDK